MTKRTDIRDVAREAGVSVATVSRVFSKPNVVSGKTAERVREMAAKLDYYPNSTARNLRTAKTKRIAVLVPDISNPFFSMVIRGITDQADDVGYAVLLTDSNDHPEIEQRCADMYFSRQIDGIIQLSARSPGARSDAQSNDALPWVNACECIDDNAISRIMVDNETGMRDLTNLVLSNGHKQLAVVTGPSASPLTRDRLSGFMDAVEKQGLSPEGIAIIEGDFSLEAGKTAIDQLLERNSQPTAIICFNDEMAIGAIHELVDRGISVPFDVSVTGFDDIPIAEYSNPGLTTVSQPCAELGRLAMAELLAIIDQPGHDRRIHRLPVSLKIRGSLGPAK